MKKLLTAGVALLSVATLAACSGKTASESSSKDAKASSSKVEKSSTSKSKSSSSSKTSKSATSSVEIPEIVLLTDEEIDNAKTLGDMKTIYGKMLDNYTKYVKEIGDKIPAAGKEAYNNQVDPAIQAMESSRKAFNDSLSSLGSDDTVIPEQPRAQVAQQLKSARDIAKQAIESAYKAISPYTSSSSSAE